MKVEFLLLEYIAKSFETPGIAIAVAYRRVSEVAEIRCQLKPGWLDYVRNRDQRVLITAVISDLQSGSSKTRSDAWTEMEESAGVDNYFRLARRGTCDEQHVVGLLAESANR